MLKFKQNNADLDHQEGKGLNFCMLPLMIKRRLSESTMDIQGPVAHYTLAHELVSKAIEHFMHLGVPQEAMTKC